MAQLPVSDNTALNAPKDLDDRKGVFQSGVFRAYSSITEANAKTLNRRYPNMEVPINIEISTGVFKDVMHRCTNVGAGTWVVSDAILLSEQIEVSNLPTPSNETFIIL